MIVAKTKDDKSIELLPKLANRHGMISGATGTGKTVTLRTMVEGFSALGVPCFVPDIKGELSGLASANPVTFWDLYCELGLPVRTSCQGMGDLLLARLMDLNRVQTGIMTLLFKVCEDKGMYALDLDDIQLGLKYLADNAYEFKLNYGNITWSSVGSIQREILSLKSQGVNNFFSKPFFDLQDMFMVNQDGRGAINILQADTLIQSPKLYTTFLLWLLSELYGRLPEAGDLDKPKFVFFFDEAHLLFKDSPKILVDKIEQIVRLIRSKGVGIYFVSQSGLDIPEAVAGQLGNRVQHVLRAFTTRDRRAAKAVAETFRDNPGIDTLKAILNMGTGQALISFLQEDGNPSPVQVGRVILPKSQLQPLERDNIIRIIKSSSLFEKYKVGVPKKPIAPIVEQQHEGFLQQQAEKFGHQAVRMFGRQMSNQVARGIFNTFFRGLRGGLGR